MPAYAAGTDTTAGRMAAKRTVLMEWVVGKRYKGQIWGLDAGVVATSRNLIDPKIPIPSMADLYDKLTRFEEYYHYLESSFVDITRIIPLENEPDTFSPRLYEIL